MDKDRAIISQVSAKIAADLTDKTLDVEGRIGEFANLFTSVNEVLMDTIYGGAMTASGSATQTNNVVAMVKDAFNGTDVSDIPAAPFTGVSIVGQQHGPIPEWLIKACKRDGIDRVYDNRDGLTVNPKRPHFKAVDAEKAYWPPRGK
jgi:hypothetical protein